MQFGTLRQETEFTGTAQKGSAREMGATVMKNGTNFAVFTGAKATEVQLCLFEGEDGRGAQHIVTLTEREPVYAGDEIVGYNWHGFVPGVGEGAYYGYRVNGPWDPRNGEVYNGAKLLIDLYALAIDGKIDPNDRSIFGFKFDPRIHEPTFPDGMPDDEQDRIRAKYRSQYEHLYWERDDRDSAASMPRCRVVDKEALLLHAGGAYGRLHRHEDAMVLEVHIGGATKAHPELQDEVDADGNITTKGFAGTFPGLASAPMIKSLKEWNVNVVEGMPSDYSFDGHSWKYNSVNFFAPDLDYAYERSEYPPEVQYVRMIRRLRDSGIEYAQDVVFNHTAEGDDRGPHLSFRGFGNKEYYRAHNPNGPGDHAAYLNHTGCGNSVNTDHPAVLRMLLDASEFKMRCGVAALRFDLLETLGRHWGELILSDVRQKEALHHDDEIIAEDIRARVQQAILTRMEEEGLFGNQLNNAADQVNGVMMLVISEELEKQGVFRSLGGQQADQAREMLQGSIGGLLQHSQSLNVLSTGAKSGMKERLSVVLGQFMEAEKEIEHRHNQMAERIREAIIWKLLDALQDRNMTDEHGRNVVDRLRAEERQQEWLSPLCGKFQRHGHHHGDFDHNHALYKIIKARYFDSHHLFGEGWDNGGYDIGKMPAASWNGPFRDDVSEFAFKKDGGDAKRLFARMNGSPEIFESPRHQVNFVSCHDGQTLWDRAFHSNDDLGGMDKTNDDAQRIYQRRVQFALAILAFSQGIPMVTFGHVRGHSQNGHHDGYKLDPAISYDINDRQRQMMESSASAFRFRAEHPELRRDRHLTGQEYYATGQRDRVSYDVSGNEIHPDNINGQCLVTMLSGKPIDEDGKIKVGKNMLSMVNGEHGPVTFTLPPSENNKPWKIEFNSHHIHDGTALEAREYMPGETITVPSRTLIAFTSGMERVIEKNLSDVRGRHLRADLTRDTPVQMA